MSQIALPFEWPADEHERDFILSDANRMAARHLEHWALWPVMATIVTGPRKSGRSMLGRIFAKKTGGRLIDDAERAGEEALFHAWNRAQEEHRPLILIADAAPPVWRIRLPDLRSRLSATPHVAIAEPDDALAAALIEKLVVARGLAPPPDLARYLLPRIERTYVSIHRIVDALDELALATRHRITLPLARKALESIGVIDASSLPR
jgi:hypothetical protein